MKGPIRPPAGVAYHVNKPFWNAAVRIGRVE
jgi:hypothetical protein